MNTLLKPASLACSQRDSMFSKQEAVGISQIT
jgi:hypothetical protein